MKKNMGFWAAASVACLVLFLISALQAGAAEPDFKVPDTGITGCYDAAGNEIVPCPAPGEAYYGQDGNLVRNGMSFTASADDTVLTDNVTGLVWQKTADATPRNWLDATDYCSNLNTIAFGGHSTGWRLPVLVELNSIMDLSVANGPAINASFTGTSSAPYWTSDEDPDNTANAWILNFSTSVDTVTNTVPKSDANYTRCVCEVAP